MSHKEKDVDRQDVSDLYRVPSLLARSIAYLIDLTIVFGTVFCINSYVPIFGESLSQKTEFRLLIFFSSFLYAVYHALSVYLAGKTLGCFVLGLRVISLKKQRISFWMAFTRGVGAMLIIMPFFPLILIVHVFHMITILLKGEDKLRRTLWDLGSRTAVIKS